MSVRAALIAAGVPASIAAREAPLAAAAMLERGITEQGPARFFLAQVLHESGRLRFFEEIADGSAYEGRCSDLGNCHPGDGRRYKGRGPIQLTGRANYRTAGLALGLPLESNPLLASQHRVGWRIAAWYWESRGLTTLARQGRFIEVTKRINGGTNGLTDRLACLAAVKHHDCRPNVLAFLTDKERKVVREFDALKKANKQEARRRFLRRVMTHMRKRVWAAAQRSGWDRAHRRARYAVLRERTR